MANINPRLEAKLKLEKEERQLSKYNPHEEEQNVIYWGKRISRTVSFVQKIRTAIWFYPDFLLIFINKLRPLSYLIILSALSLLFWQTAKYAYAAPNSILHHNPQQILYEGAVGQVTTINPLFITHNQNERDMQALIFNKLVGIGEDGNPIPELAETWAVSADGKTYTFFLNPNVKWHDGEIMTADDVIFTFETIQKLKDEDSYYDAFADVQIGKIDEFTVVFTLPDTSSNFMESLSVGIIPEHILKNVSPQKLRSSNFSKYPIGTGPFMINENTDKYITLKANPDYFKGKPKLEGIRCNFYTSQDEAITALQQYQIQTLNEIDPQQSANVADYSIFQMQSVPLYLREKILYINLRNEGPLSSMTVREALSNATNRDEIINAVGTGEEALGPIPQTSWAFDDTIERYRYNLTSANDLLESEGWTYPENTQSIYRQKDGQELTVTLSLLESDTNNTIAQILKTQWAAVGINLVLDTQKYEKISSETIPRRDFDVLLFEIEMSPDPDKYNLWHSLKSDYPGLNLSGYSYDRVDILLERARKETNKELRREDYALFQKYIMRDMPAIYLYHPTFNFIVHKSVKGIDLEGVYLPQERYHNIENWYIE